MMNNIFSLELLRRNVSLARVEEKNAAGPFPAVIRNFHQFSGSGGCGPNSGGPDPGWAISAAAGTQSRAS